ncbi:MAG: hypothetical protein ACI9EF_002493, partial [Pseudohongiellaceae bacterium]
WIWARIPAVTTDAKQLFETSIEQVAAGQVRKALATLLDALVIDPKHHESIEAAGRICRMLGAPEDAALFEQLAEAPNDPEALFCLGHRLVAQERPDAGSVLLLRSLKALPPGTESSTVRRELAFARFLERRFGDCLSTLSPLANDPELSETESLDVLLLQAEASLCAGRRELSEQFLASAEELGSDDRQRQHLDALHALIGRASHWPESLTDLGLREWHFIQHGGVLLKTAGGYFEDGSMAGRFEVLDLRLDMVAFLLQRMAHLLNSRGLLPEVIISASPLAEPLAQALGRYWGLPVLNEMVERAGRDALLVATNAAEFTPVAAGLVHHRAELRLFALNLDWSQDAIVCPELVGVLARRVFLPWETRYTVEEGQSEMKETAADPRSAQEIAADLVTAMGALPDDDGKARGEFESFYAPLSSGLVLGNEHAHPLRRQFTHVSPAWTPMRRPGLAQSEP